MRCFGFVLGPISYLRWVALLLLWIVLPGVGGRAEELPNPHPRAFVLGESLQRWDFADGLQGWDAVNDCTIEAREGLLHITSRGVDPYLVTGVDTEHSELAVRIRMRLKTRGEGQFFWASQKSRGFAADRQSTFTLHHDDRWHEYTVPLSTDGGLTALRLDPGMAEGHIQVDWIELLAGAYHPLEIVRMETPEAQPARVVVRNHGSASVQATVNDQPVVLAAADDTPVPVTAPQQPPLVSLPVRVSAEGLPPIERRLWSYRMSGAADELVRELPGIAVHVASDGSYARLVRDGEEVAALAPLAHIDGELPNWESLEPDAWPLDFTGEGIRLTLGSTEDGQLAIQIDSEHEVEGPVVRPFGGLEQGLLSGVEYLGRGEQSSSRRDIETEDHLRFEPDPMHVTMPLMAFVTDRTSVAMLWEDTELQPTFAAPDFIDYAPGHRMSLKGRRIDVTLRIADGWTAGGRLEDAILWAVQRRGLPPLPEVPRTREAQMALSLSAYRGRAYDPETGGWFHAVLPGVRSMPERGAPFGDCASAIFRMTGEMPPVDRLQLGGAHVRNSTSFLVSGRARQWLQIIDGQAAQLRRTQLPDGSYRYDGKYLRGHFEDTASGHCARPAFVLLEHARYTGNQESLDAALRTLEFIRRFRTPRGSQTWEISLHTPDVLASAQLVWAHVRAYELTGEASYREAARRWALTGLPFVYQWSNQPIMAYSTIAVYGATNWQRPVWIGLPVQWCGTVYAHALLMLAAHDDTLDWRQVAEGILISGEQQQYPDGPSQGMLPDAFQLETQMRFPYDIHPGVLVQLRLQIEGRPAGLAVAADETHRVVSPFPVELHEGRATIQAPEGLTYQIIVDGQRVVDVTSQGEDVVLLSDP